MRIVVDGLGVELTGTPVLTEIDLIIEPGSFTGLAGPNGSGKSTLLRCLYRALRPTAGVVRIGADDVWRTGTRRAGRRTAVVAQDHGLEHAFTVLETVAMGRIPHQDRFGRERDHDREIVRAALDRVGLGWAAERRFAALSGGERQRVLLARALAQQTPVLLLDELTNHLDPGAQLELLTLVRELGLTTIAALHDLDHALAYCDALVLLHDGRVAATGAPADVLTPDRIAAIFGMRSAIVPHPLTGRPHLVTALPEQHRPETTHRTHR
ncbi:ABC transporter ATP-binding protein [Nocardia sp. CDC159]|uniref:ABC transporter ATP-binding protein n=1 Tax=Nocardia pulmonis TaxID=2951408 RepID=A0A9X2E3P4_9NOCA|nr:MULTISPECIES: ABC transporter ATP-binding protein [Nocardia]MCM6772503.1 ABC transporter ATP-binding protein [Nocardia pulmonis]MCM6784839.1 ABC transporter ATP-binding protein [Nocardia sp. CDC159]